jgi:uracil-DNA glycosylase
MRSSVRDGGLTARAPQPRLHRVPAARATPAAHPRSHRDPAVLARKRGLLESAHMTPLAAYAARLRARHGAGRLPDFDPAEAGVGARLLVLMEAPGPRAAPLRGGSGFVSCDNDSPTSATLWDLHRRVGTDRAAGVATWNVVPWYLGDERRIRPARRADLAAARPAIAELVTLLSELRVVLALGRVAAAGWRALGVDVPTIEAPHPSPQNLAARPHHRAEILDALRRAHRLSGL